MPDTLNFISLFDMRVVFSRDESHIAVNCVENVNQYTDYQNRRDVLRNIILKMKINDQFILFLVGLKT